MLLWLLRFAAVAEEVEALTLPDLGWYPWQQQ
jgi:hypothetical protein